MARIGLILLTLVAVLGGCAPEASALTCPNTIRVGVLKTGGVTLDGKAATLAALDTRLAALATTDGAVWYWREDSHRTPTSAAETAMHDVLELLVKHRRPVSFSYNADYGDVIDDQGNSSPRTKC